MIKVSGENVKHIYISPKEEKVTKGVSRKPSSGYSFEQSPSGGGGGGGSSGGSDTTDTPDVTPNPDVTVDTKSSTQEEANLVYLGSTCIWAKPFKLNKYQYNSTFKIKRKSSYREHG